MTEIKAHCQTNIVNIGLTVKKQTCKWRDSCSPPHPSTLPQKNSQLSEEDHMLLYDSCCLFLYLVPKLQAEFPGDVVDKHVELFMKGHLGVFGLE